MTVDVDKVHKYLLEHPRRGEVFPAWTDEQILDIFEQARLVEGSYLSIDSETGAIRGCVISFPRHDTGYLYITAFFAEDKTFWKFVMAELFQRFPYYHIAGRVAGKFVKYNNAFLRRQFQDISRN